MKLIIKNNDRIIFNGETFLSLKEVSRQTSISVSRLKSKINKSGKNSIISFNRTQMNGRWYIPQSELPFFKEESRIINSGEYYSISEASEIIKGIYHNSPHCKIISTWVTNGLLRGIGVRPKTCRETYFKKEWVNKFAKTKKYRVNEASKMWGINYQDILSRACLPELDDNRISLGEFPSGEHYVTEDEIQRVAEYEKTIEVENDTSDRESASLKKTKRLSKKIRVGDFASGGEGGHAGKIEKIVRCNEVPDMNWCKECEENGRLKKRYIISGRDYCRKIVQKM